MNKPYSRTFLFILVFGLILVLPWWLGVIILVGLTLYFPFYPEVLFFGFLFDTLYAGKYTFPFTGLTTATIFLFFIIYIKTRIRT